ncbi:MAG: zonular occludens toxin domain-containing protein [Planktothrix sp.]|uniref:zonular occludens toxin domain-containing protein n=3 Tax=Planktothrix sp. TaxID=3088171 RepID=UPI0038D363FE
MPFTGIYGLPGKGKSLFMVQYALRLAEQYNLRIVSNFLLNQYALAYYCKVQNYQWLSENLDKGLIYYVSANRNFAQLLQIPNAVILIDEFGIYAPSSQHWTLPPEAYNAIANNRKNLQFIIFAAQYPNQIHSSVHEILSDVIYCEGITVWDKKLRNDRLLSKDAHAFDPAQFQIWYRDPKLRKNPIKVWVLAKKHWKGVLNALDALTFKCYDSFTLLERQDSLVKFGAAEFDYFPWIINNLDQEKIDLENLEARGLTLIELDGYVSSIAQAESKKRKRIFEASTIPPFIAWRLEGVNPVKVHYFNKFLAKFWTIFPASSFNLLRRIDFWLDREWQNYSKLSEEERSLFQQIIKWIKRGVLLIFVLWVWSWLT